MRNGWRTFRIGASAGRFGGVIAFRRGIERAETRDHRVQIESPGEDWRRIPILSTLGFLRGFGRMRRWMQRRGKFYPTSVLVTGPDIIFFWVARMIIAGLRVQAGQIEQRSKTTFRFAMSSSPESFATIQGRKMSEVVRQFARSARLDREIRRRRFALWFNAHRAERADIRFDEKQIEEGRNFATKLWNAARFRQMHGPSASRTRDRTSIDFRFTRSKFWPG